MRDRQLYAKILDIQSPWTVDDVELDVSSKEVCVLLTPKSGTRFPCPLCNQLCPGYDSQERRWRHLDTCNYRTILVARVPRVECPEHGVHAVKVPWAEPGSRFTALFEALAIDWLKEASISAVAEHMGLSWDEADGIMQRAVKRGLERRGPTMPAHLGVDEKAFRRGHDYVTVVNDATTRTVVYVADGRKKESLDGFFDAHEPDVKASVQSIAMDMWEPYILSAREHIPDADSKIAFDKFHVAKYLGEAVNSIRLQENKTLTKNDDERLKGTRYLWLMHPDKFSDEQWDDFEALRTSKLKTARAWAIKEAAMELWDCSSRAGAEDAWRKWYGWAIRSRLEPMKSAARMVKRHLAGIITAATTGVTNASAEGINSVIKLVQHTARGFRNRERFKSAIYFHLGGLDMYPQGVSL